MKNRRKRLAYLHKLNPNCRYCGEETIIGWGNGKKQATLDHRIPKSLGGEDTPKNTVLSCAGCNSKKGCLTYMQFRELQNEKIIN